MVWLAWYGSETVPPTDTSVLKKHVLLFSCLQKNMFSCSHVFKKKHVLLSSCLKKNMFSCPHVLKTKTCSLVLMSSKKTCSLVLMSSKKNMLSCPHVFKKNMFSCSHVLKTKTCYLVLMSSKNMFSCQTEGLRGTVRRPYLLLY